MSSSNYLFENGPARSRDTLQQGLLWKIGDGNSTHARRDAWIPSLAQGKITSAVAYESNVLVKELILPSKKWDVPKLEELFLPYEV